MPRYPGGEDRLYVWFDAEYSDLDLERARLLQVSAIITDTSLKRVLPREQDVRLIVRLPDRAALSPWVEQNLPDLVRLCRSSGALHMDEADGRLADYVYAAAGSPAEREDQRPVLAGNSVHADWWLARRDLPRFSNCLHYRHLDVTALKLEWQRQHPHEEFEKENPEVIRRYFPEAVLPVSGGRHDAYYDVQASIAELSFYRLKFLNCEAQALSGSSAFSGDNTKNPRAQTGGGTPGQPQRSRRG